MNEKAPTFYFIKFSSDPLPVRLHCEEWRTFMLYIAGEMQKRGIIEWMILE
jgi:hypothetical protein